MATSSAKKVDDYVAAVRARDSFAAGDPADFTDYERMLKLTRTRVTELERTLTGGELGRARRLLACGS